jgi:hypothetical protein
MPAAGFAVDLDSAAEALHVAGVTEPAVMRVVAFGPGAEASATELRSRGVAAVTAATRAAAFEWARAWGFTHVLDAGRGATIAAHLSEGGT